MRSVRLEQLPFTEQVALMAEVTIVVGPTGAQWAGWLFSERAVGLILVPGFLTRSCLFAKLGAPGKSELLELSMNSDAISWESSTRVATRVDVSRLKQAVQLIVQSA